MKGSNLLDFLIALGTDPAVLQRYQQDRNAAMDAAGLSDEEKALLLQGNPHQLRAAIMAAGGRTQSPAAVKGTEVMTSQTPSAQGVEVMTTANVSTEEGLAMTPPATTSKPGSSEE